MKHYYAYTEMLTEGRLKGRKKKGGRREASRGDCSDESSHFLKITVSLGRDVMLILSEAQRLGNKMIVVVLSTLFCFVFTVV